VDRETIERLDRSFRVAEATPFLGRRVAINESSWYNPVSWSLPTIYNVEVDWPRVHETAAVFKLQCAGFRLDWVSAMANVGYEMRCRASGRRKD
jgi:hypothetical protein